MRILKIFFFTVWISMGMLMLATPAISSEEQQVYDVTLIFKFSHPTLHDGYYQDKPFFEDEIVFEARPDEISTFNGTMHVRFPGLCEYIADVSTHKRPFNLEIDVEHNLSEGIGKAAISLNSLNEVPGWRASDDEIHILVGPDGANHIRGIVYDLPTETVKDQSCRNINVTGYILLSTQSED